MFSEIATERTVKVIVQEIKSNLEDNRNNLAVCMALRKLGRFALTQFEWDRPKWAKEYKQLFDEKNIRPPIFRKAKTHWTTLISTFGKLKGVDVVFKDLIASYGESHRAYHTLDHIVALLDECDEVTGLLADPRLVKMAIWYHDVVYEPGTKKHRVIAGNEERSAYRAELDMKRLGLPRAFIARVKKLILATKHTTPDSADPDTRFLADLDLAILGRPREEFDAYEAGIRREYEWVPYADYCLKRIQILRSFLNRPSIYSTSFFRDRYESTARENLKGSIQQLQG